MTKKAQMVWILTYREMQIFSKGINWRILLLAAGVITLLLWTTGHYGGLFGSILLAMIIGIQNILCLRGSEGKRSLSGIIAKYLSVAVTVVISVVGSILCNLLAYRGIPDPWLFQIALWSSMLIPLLWTSMCLPVFYYWGFHGAKIISLILVIPIFYLVKFFEDGPGISALPLDFPNWIARLGFGAAVLFLISALISTASCRQNLQRREG